MTEILKRYWRRIFNDSKNRTRYWWTVWNINRIKTRNKAGLKMNMEKAKTIVFG